MTNTHTDKPVQALAQYLVNKPGETVWAAQVTCGEARIRVHGDVPWYRTATLTVSVHGTGARTWDLHQAGDDLRRFGERIAKHLENTVRNDLSHVACLDLRRHAHKWVNAKAKGSSLTQAQRHALFNITSHWVTPGNARPKWTIHDRTLKSLIDRGLVYLVTADGEGREAFYAI